jgi:hypothetical protein
VPWEENRIVLLVRVEGRCLGEEAKSKSRSKSKKKSLFNE